MHLTDEDEKYLTTNPETGSMTFNYAMAWYDVVVRLNPDLRQEVNDALRLLGLPNLRTVTPEQVKERVDTCCMVLPDTPMPDGRPTACWMLITMLSGIIPISEGAKQMISSSNRATREAKRREQAAKEPVPTTA